MTTRKPLEDMLLEMLADPVAIAAQTDLAQAVALERQTLSFRQRAGAAAVRLRRARVDGADAEEITALEGRLQTRVARLDSALMQASAANVKRPAAQKGTAQVFARASGTVEKPPLTLAAIDKTGAVLATQATNASGVAHMLVEGDLSQVTLQFSDCDERVLYRSTDPVSVQAGTVFYLDAEIGTPAPKPCPVPTSTKMPDLIGQSREVAKALLQRLGNANLDYKTKLSDGPPGVVLEQDPAQGTVLGDKTKITLTLSKQSAGTPDQLYMPGVMGDLASVARARLKAVGLEVEFIFKQTESPPNVVLSQEPKEGRPLKPGASVALIISQSADIAPTTVIVPDLRAKSGEVALEVLKTIGLKADISHSTDPKAKAGVIDQDPAAGITVALKSVVKLVINTPKQPEVSQVLLPNFSGQPLPDARAILQKLRLKAEVTHRVDGGPKDQVLAQNPPAGTRVAPQSTVGLTVSTEATDENGELTRLSRVMALDPRAANVAGDAARIETLLRASAVESLAAARILSRLEPSALRDRMGLSRLKAATTFRAILLKSLKELD